ncbi:uncharacterized protein LOC112082074 [Eutrema salsugineum]|uniref:uncharacterized protein LOC112082074 n=1 Tax=Eutrema salsugineum TaxID=72664 RepID=UPI000CED63A6|nr:uncharacterized protein LOC112082074 [Eutrema salsugineum]
MAALLKSKYENTIGCPRASELPAIVISEYNITASCWKCWKVKELAIYSAHGTEETSFKLLPIYLHVLKYANPGTITHLSTERDEKGMTRFKSIFMALAACIFGWKHLKPVVVVDGTHLIDSSELTIISDRHGGISKAKKDWYPHAHHGACHVHIQRNVHAKYKGSGQKGLIGKAGEAFTVSNFKRLYARLKDVDYSCWEYMEKIPLALWTRSHFSGQRYNMTSSNIAESLNNALFAARDSPIVAMLEFIRRMLSRWIECRREKIQKIDGDIPEVDKLMNLQLEKSAALSLQGIFAWEVEVSSEFIGVRRHVDLLNKTCTCLEFQTLKYPCRHAMAAARFRQVEYSSLVDPILKKSIWSEKFSGKILLVPDPDDIRISAELQCLTCGTRVTLANAEHGRRQGRESIDGYIFFHHAPTCNEIGASGRKSQAFPVSCLRVSTRQTFQKEWASFVSRAYVAGDTAKGRNVARFEDIVGENKPECALSCTDKWVKSPKCFTADPLHNFEKNFIRQVWESHVWK